MFDVFGKQQGGKNHKTYPSLTLKVRKSAFRYKFKCCFPVLKTHHFPLLFVRTQSQTCQLSELPNYNLSRKLKLGGGGGEVEKETATSTVPKLTNTIRAGVRPLNINSKR